MPFLSPLILSLFLIPWAAVTVAAKPVTQVVLGSPAYETSDNHTSSVLVADSPWYLARIAQFPKLQTVAAPGENPTDGNLPRLRSFVWDYPRNDAWGTNVLVYVLDSGIRATHTEFRDITVMQGAAVASGVGSPGISDEGDHGTGVAALVAGRRTGVAKSATIVPVKIARSRAETPQTPTDVLEGLQWAHQDFTHRRAGNPHLKAVINISWIVRNNVAVAAALETAIETGMHVVIAAGNGDKDECLGSTEVPPEEWRIGDYGQVVVSSIDWLDGWWNNHGPCVHLAAPGFNMRIASSSGDDDYHVEGASSQAAPLVSGVIAALISPGQPGEHMSPRELRELLLSTYTHPGVQDLPGNTPDRILRAPDPHPQ